MELDIFDRTGSWEKVLYLILVVVFFFLLFFQVLCQREPFWSALNAVERLEGVTWSPNNCSQVQASGQGVAKIEIATFNHVAVFPPIDIIINCQKVVSFKKESVVITVRDGDEILIDGSKHKEPLTFRIKRLSAAVLWPPSDYLVTTSSSRVSLGRVKMKNYSGWGD